MKIFFFLTSITFALNLHATWKENLSYRGEVGITFRQFDADENKQNEDYQIALDGRIATTYEGEQSKFYFSSFARVDKEDNTRNIFNVDESYYKRTFGEWSMSLGNHIFNWSVLEIFHPVDSINSRNLDANADLVERLGQPALVITKEFESSILQFIPLLQTISPKMPSPINRNGPQVNLEAARFVEDDFQFTNHPKMFEWVLHFLKNFETFDLDVHFARKYDTANPVIATPKTANISPSLEDLKIVPYYLPVSQFGIAVQGNQDVFTYKFEHIYYDFDNYKVEFFIPPTVLSYVTKQDFSLTAFGIEYNKTYQNDQEGTWFVEYQTILGTTIEEARQLNAFQRDLGLGYRHNFNDFKGHEIIMYIIHDLDRYNEQIINFRHSVRLSESWKFLSEIRIIQAPLPTNEASLDNFSGLKPIAESDNITFKLTKFF